MSATRYHFFSSVRQGLASAIKHKPASDKQRAEIGLGLHVGRRLKGRNEWDSAVEAIKRTVQLYGPGDVVGFDKRIVVRTDPVANSGNFEPNYFPAIEFAEPDFLWRFSPEPAHANGLMPWITLIVLEAEDRGESGRREFEQLPGGRNQIPVIRVFDQTNLPDLEHAWRWAHVQVAGVEEDPQDVALAELLDTFPDAAENYEDALRAYINNYPERIVARLLCPRRLKPKTLYRAFVVPVFKLGWAAGLDTPVAREAVKECGALDLAWGKGAGSVTSIDLPFYYDWEFRTSERGDFEHLVRMLKPKELKGLGLRELDCEHPGFGLTVERWDELDSEKHHILMIEGALQSLDTAQHYTRWGKDKLGPSSVEPPPQLEPELFQKQLAENLLNLDESDQAQVKLPKDFDPERLITNIDFDLQPDGKSVRITWKTSVTSTGLFEYGRKTASPTLKFEWVKASDNPALEHTVIVILAPATSYHFRIAIRKYVGQRGLATPTGPTKYTGVATLFIPLPIVAPPIYGRWHAARQEVVADAAANGWLDVLNLDPRHRASAGLGAEVIRKQQEALMASAWDQVGVIEAANQILRQAQAGREESTFLYDRLRALPMDKFMQITAPLHKRILRKDEEGKSYTVSTELKETTQIPAAFVSSAYRRISRPRGVIHKRQVRKGAVFKKNVMERLVSGKFSPAGEHPKPEGTLSLCDVTRRVHQEYDFGRYAPPEVTPPGDITVEADDAAGVSINSYKLHFFLEGATAHDYRKKPLPVAFEAPQQFPPGLATAVTFKTTDIFGNIGTAQAYVTVAEYGVEPPGGPTGPGGGVSSMRLLSPSTSPAGGDGIENETNTEDIANGDTDAGVNSGTSSDIQTNGPTRPEDIKDDPIAMKFCDHVITCEQLPSVDALEKMGMENSKEIREAFCGTGEGNSEPSVISDFLRQEEQPKKPIHKNDFLVSLREDILTALDPRHTIKARTQKRLCLKGELAKRFDEDAKGDPLDEILAYPKFPQPMYEPLRDLSQSHILPGVEKVPQNTISLLQTNRRFMEAYMVGLNHEFSSELLWRRYPTDQRGSYFRQFWDVRETKKWQEGINRESLKDITELHKWGEAYLGNNYVGSKGESLVLIIRGDLLKRYPNAVIYAVDADDNMQPKLAEYGEAEPEPIYPVFRGNLGGDLVFLGFPFTEMQARSSGSYKGKFFVLEERIGEARFGLDSSDEDVAIPSGSSVDENVAAIDNWDNLHWGYFQLANSYGEYLDSTNITVSSGDEVWDEKTVTSTSTSSAFRARVTLQRPARIVLHADQMLPPPSKNYVATPASISMSTVTSAPK